jgi:hypothetical protein
MPVITLDDQALKSIKSSMNLKKRILLLNHKTYLARLKSLEKTHGMTTAEFRERFDSGRLGDEPDWFDWDFLQRAYDRTAKELKILSNARI